MRATQQLFRFGVFELNLDTEELRKDGIPMKLPPQPFAILALLAGRSGQLVTREDIQKQIWGEGTFVDFEHGLNQCIKQIRTALNDNTERPVYVETVPRRGYRFLAPVVSKTVAAPAPKVVESKSGIQPSPAATKLLEKPPSADTYGAQDGALPRSKLEPAGLTGKTVSHYRVLNIIGGGGMGVVYKAEDLKLPRAVALKFLPEEVRNDPVALEQFAREARSASVLDHPNICSIYEFGEHEGRPFIVMQLLEGQTLRDLLAVTDAGDSPGTALPLDQLLSIAIQTTDGLEAAHEKNIIHRDIKPANIFITTKGVAKILDFGLAKPIQTGEKGDLAVAAGMQSSSPPLGPASQALSPTFQSMATGTAAYMSPEQVRGEKLDARTDLFSFGLVLYEMATGRQAFHSDTVAGLQDAILNGTPTPAQEINPGLPDELQEIIQKCMERDRELRYQHAADIRSDLEKIKREIQQPYWLRRWKMLATAVVMFALLSGGLYWKWHKTATLTAKDTIVLADFNNTTGEGVWDDTLKQALAIQLEQSPFLNVLSDQRVNGTLALMKRPPNERLTAEVAQEVCLRTNSKALLAGSIAAVGEHYLVTLKAVDCQTGDSLASAVSEAENRKKVLRAVGDVGDQLREKLGESLTSVQKFNKPLEEATTPSLEALQAYSRARRVQMTGEADPILYLKRALELDPNFAAAYAALGSAYSDSGQSTLAIQNYKKAYELRNRANEHERFYIEANYADATGESERAVQTYTEWSQAYPGTYEPHNNLSVTYRLLGQYEKSAEEARETIHLNPEHIFGYINLGIADNALNHPAQGEAVFEEALSRKLDYPFLRLGQYYAAFLQGDVAAMQKELSRALGKPGFENLLLSAQSDTEAYYGRLDKAREISERAVESAKHASALEVAAEWKANEALREAEAGNAARARQLAEQALALMPGRDVEAVAALTLASAGDVAQAQKLVDKLDQEFPVDTLMQGYTLPTIRAVIEVERNNPQKALDVLQATAPYEMGGQSFAWLYPAYVRGLAYLKAGQAQPAAVEFQKILDHPGIMLNFVTGALARLQLARAQAMNGDKGAAQKSYQDFFALWKGADADIPILKAAHADYEKLK